MTRRLLLVEPQFLWRRTIAAVVRELGIGEVEEFLRVEALRDRLRNRDVDALVLSLDDSDGVLSLLEDLRQIRQNRSRPLPVIVLAECCDTEMALRLRALEVRRLLLKPFKLKQVVESVAELWPEEVAALNRA